MQRRRAKGFSHWACSRASSAWEQQRQQSRPGSRWATRPLCRKGRTSEGSSPPRLRWAIWRCTNDDSWHWTLVVSATWRRTCCSNAVEADESVEARRSSCYHSPDTIRKKSAHSVRTGHIDSRAQVSAGGRESDALWAFTVCDTVLRTLLNVRFVDITGLLLWRFSEPLRWFASWRCLPWWSQRWSQTAAPGCWLLWRSCLL